MRSQLTGATHRPQRRVLAEEESGLLVHCACRGAHQLGRYLSSESGSLWPQYKWCGRARSAGWVRPPSEQSSGYASECTLNLSAGNESRPQVVCRCQGFMPRTRRAVSAARASSLRSLMSDALILLRCKSFKLERSAGLLGFRVKSCRVLFSSRFRMLRCCCGAVRCYSVRLCHRAALVY